MSNQEINKEVSSLIKQLNYLRQNPELDETKLQELKAKISEAIQLIKAP